HGSHIVPATAPRAKVSARRDSKQCSDGSSSVLAWDEGTESAAPTAPIDPDWRRATNPSGARLVRRCADLIPPGFRAAPWTEGGETNAVSYAGQLRPAGFRHRPGHQSIRRQ